MIKQKAVIAGADQVGHFTSWRARTLAPCPVRSFMMGPVEQPVKTVEHLIVDEYQDVNPAQERLIRLPAGPQVDLCVAGGGESWRNFSSPRASIPRQNNSTAVVASPASRFARATDTRRWTLSISSVITLSVFALSRG
jgi:hypothetical protein